MSFIFKELNSLVLLTKPRVIFLIVFTAIIGMLLSSQNILLFPINLLFYWYLDDFSSAAVFNCIIERDFDSKMKRTKNRPLVKNEVKLSKCANLWGIYLFFWNDNSLFFCQYINSIANIFYFCWLYNFIYSYIKTSDSTKYSYWWSFWSNATCIRLDRNTQNGITFEPLVLFLIILYGPHHIFGL